MRYFALSTILLACFVLSATSTSAGVATTHLLPLQGFATDNHELALTGVDIHVRIYDAPTSGILVYDSGDDFTGSVSDGIVDLALGSSTVLQLDNTRGYYMEIDLNGQEMVGDANGGRWLFYPGGGRHDRPDLEARLDALEALKAPGQPKPTSSKEVPASAFFEGSSANYQVELGILGDGLFQGGSANYWAIGNHLPQPVGIFTAGNQVLKLGPFHIPPRGQVVAVEEPSLPTRTQLYSCYPNPFNPRTTISFDLRDRAAVSLRIYDLSGRLVRTLLAGDTLDGGHHEAIWNGQDESRRGVASGTYFYRLETGDYVETRSMTLVK